MVQELIVLDDEGNIKIIMIYIDYNLSIKTKEASVDNTSDDWHQ